MVWHSFMLNPRCYLEDCLRQGMLSLWHTGIPWSAVQNSLNVSGTYNPGAGAKKALQANVKRHWDNLEDSSKLNIQCPNRSGLKDPHTLSVPWTTRGAWMKGGASRGAHTPETLVAQGDGYADRDFSTRCPRYCQDVTHDALRTTKFNGDMGLASSNNYPMPGSVLSTDGRVGSRASRKDSRSFASRFVVAMSKSSSCGIYWPDLEHVRADIERALRNKDILRSASNGTPPSREERTSIRRMMSWYWQNSSPFALDLVSAP